MAMGAGGEAVGRLKIHIVDESEAEAPGRVRRGGCVHLQSTIKKVVNTDAHIAALEIRKEAIEGIAENLRVHDDTLGEIGATVLDPGIELYNRLGSSQLEKTRSLALEARVVQLYHQSTTQAIKVREAIAASSVLVQTLGSAMQ